MSDGTPIDADEIQLWRELQQVTGNATVSITCVRKGRVARIAALQAAITAERTTRGPAHRGGTR
jgi:hypothetical protein